MIHQFVYDDVNGWAAVALPRAWGCCRGRKSLPGGGPIGKPAKRFIRPTLCRAICYLVNKYFFRIEQSNGITIGT